MEFVTAISVAATLLTCNPQLNKDIAGTGLHVNTREAVCVAQNIDNPIWRSHGGSESQGDSCDK